MRSRWVLVLTLAVLAGILSAPTVGANEITRTDGNDVAFPLDLRAVTVTHASGQQVFRITTHAAFTNSDFDGERGWFRVGFDTGSGRFERTVYIQYIAGAVRGILTDGDGNFIRKVSASRVATNAVQIRVANRLVGSTLNYRFAVWTVWRAAPCSRRDPCLDWLPNDSTILHDLAPPAIAWGDVPDPSTEGSATLRVKVPFKIRDAGGYASGVKSWTLLGREVGTTTWTQVKRGKGGGSISVPFTGEEGETYQFQVSAVDRQGNARTSAVRPRIHFPFDDLGSRVAYGPTEVAWTGQAGLFRSFLGTRHIADQPGARVSFTFKASKGTRVCVVGGPSAGPVTADAVLDGRSYADALVERAITEHRGLIGCLRTTSAGPRHTLRVTTDVEGLVVDGFVVG